MIPIVDQMRPSEVSQLIAEQHRAVALTLTELSRVAETLQTSGGAAALARTRELGAILCDQLLRHVVVEGDVLIAALRDADAWGACRADKLSARLLVRRQEIGDLRESCRAADGATLSDTINTFVGNRREAIARLQANVLSTLRDDVVGIDFQGG